MSNFKEDKSRLKSSATRLQTTINNMDKPADPVNIQFRLTELERAYRAFIENYGHLEEEEIVNELTIAEDHVMNVRSLAIAFIRQETEYDRSSSTPSPTPSSRNESLVQVKLPTISLPTFDGTLETWIEFHDTFNSLIHQNDTLSEIQKFHYLKGALKGTALQTINAISLSANNYAIAWETLQKKFTNKRRLVETHMRALLNLPSASISSLQSWGKLLDLLNTHYKGLCKIAPPTAEDVIIYIVLTKFDAESIKKWTEYSASVEMPTLDMLYTFIETQQDILASVTHQRRRPAEDHQHRQPKHKVSVYHTRSHDTNSHTQSTICPKCKENHALYKCPSFKELTTDQRYEFVRKSHLCNNCLHHSSSTHCHSLNTCHQCKGKHHTLLHRTVTPPTSETSVLLPENSPATTSLQSNYQLSTSVLSTTLINIQHKNGTFLTCRALLDSGSQTNFITESLAKKLQLPLKQIHAKINGIGQSNSNINNATSTRISSTTSSFITEIDLLILPHITGLIPQTTYNVQNLKLPPEIQLADPDFNVSAPVDLLIGASIFWQLLRGNQINIPHSTLSLQDTVFGWIVTGTLFTTPTISCHLVNELHDDLQKFWTIEEPPKPVCISENHQHCEELFKSTTSVCNNKFIVHLPFKDNISQLVNNYNNALRQFYSLERRLNKNHNLRKQYIAFLNEYKSLGHMTEAHNTDGYFLPHHCVLKEDSTTTKLRVVFNGSSASNGLSLNDVLYVGPTLQPNLIELLLRFRIYKYAITADIEKMYRQVNVIPNHRKYQKIIWRDSPSDPIKIFELNTVTYGTASAPYLATRAIQEVCNRESARFPVAANIALRDFYVDDLLTGANSKDELFKIKNDLCTMFNEYSFNLRKWKSNAPEICSNKTEVKLDIDDATKTLGLIWSTTTDSLQYRPNIKPSLQPTKRTVLSTIARIHDLLGLLSPIIIRSKIFMQQLWCRNLDWDEPLPEDIKTIWMTYEQNLIFINNVRIPRCVIYSDTVSLHGFCDASEKAYGAAIYMVSTDKKGTRSQLLCAKTRVAPLKTISIPRLELCGANLLASLVHAVQQTIPLKFASIHLWSDSTIVLNWIQRQPYTLKTFVANRVSNIQGLTSPSNWRHIPTQQNPADILSRGTDAKDLINCKLWWHGPTFLQEPETEWPKKQIEFTEPPELKIVTNTAITKIKEDFTNRFSSLIKLKRVAAYCNRFINNSKQNSSKQVGPLTIEEINKAWIQLLITIQQEEFTDELVQLTAKKSISRNSKLIKLQPFVCPDGLLRVGGRLQSSSLPYCQKHPIILPAKHHLTKLIINYEHLRCLHGGPQAVLAAIRMMYWPINGRSTVKQIIRSCMTCCKVNPLTITYPMGNLPKNRLQVAKPFTNTGVDFCGPFFTKLRHDRGTRTNKTYVAVFVCFATKAVHMELVMDLTTAAFINCLKRVVSRRGKIANLYSDNATNFVGANNELKELETLWKTKEHKATLNNFATTEGMKWHFIPVRSPHFGGLWEAAVKSAKKHFYRIAGNASLSYEELQTLIIQIEGCLNSRPLMPLTDDLKIC